MDESYFESEFDGVEPEDVDEIARDVLDSMDEEERDQFFRKLEQDRVNDSLKEWKVMYGFDHECSCASDAEAEKFIRITECYAGACEDAFAELRRVRAFLYAIATSPSQRPGVLKALAAEAFGITN